MSLQESIDQFIEVRGYISKWRLIGSLTEEAGEVQGAFNKMMDGHRSKPKTIDDVIGELIQLTGNCFLVARHYGIDVETLLREAAKFLDDKRAMILIDGWTPDDQLECGQETNPGKR